VPGASSPDGGARPEEQLLTESGRDIVVITLVVAVTVGLFAAVADHGMMSRIQQLDDAWLRLMISGRAGPLIALAKIFNILGLVYVTLPGRIAVAGFLAVRRGGGTWPRSSRRWCYRSAIGLPEAATTGPGHSVAGCTSGASFPSGTPSPRRSPWSRRSSRWCRRRRTPWALARPVRDLDGSLSGTWAPTGCQTPPPDFCSGHRGRC
jgi:hypothetical protein